MWSWLRRFFRGIEFIGTISSLLSSWEVALSGLAAIVTALASWLEGQTFTWIALSSVFAFTIVIWGLNGLNWRRLQLQQDPNLEPDAELPDAIEYIKQNTRFGKLANEDDILRHLRFAAFDGSITIWGAVSKGMRMGTVEISMREKIPKTYWEDMIITRHNLKPTQIETDKTMHEDGNIVGVREHNEYNKVNYNFLYINMRQIKFAFPWWSAKPKRIVYH